jgi:DNA-binding SARP family transcriptional activator
VTLAALTAGLPALLYAAGGNPVPHAAPPWHKLMAALARPENPAVVLGAVRDVSWLAWAVFTACVAAELTAGLSGRKARTVPRLALLQGLAAVLVTAILAGPAEASAAAHPSASWAARSSPPATPPQAGHPAARRADYRVQPGDDLWNIAATHLGDGEAWHRIWTLNRDRPQPGGGELTSPRLIRPGWLLRLPASARHHPGPARRQPPKPGLPPHTARSWPPRPATPIPPQEPQPGISLPSGSLAGAGLAAAVAAAAAIAAVHRRRGYHSGGLAGQSRPPAPPVPRPVAAMRRAARLRGAPPDSPGHPHRQACGPDPSLLSPRPAPPDPGLARPPVSGLLFPEARVTDPGRPGGTPDRGRPGTARRRTRSSPGRCPLGHRDSQEICVDLAAYGGLGLTGPGAPGAARSILASLLGCGLPARPHGPADVIVPASGVSLLLPGDRPGDLAGVVISPSHDAALAAAEELILRRTRLLDNHHDPQLPPAALFATADRPAIPRLAAIAQNGRTAGVAVIVLGDWPAGTTCHVAADGSASSSDPRLDGTRLYHLTTTDTAAVLGVLREAGGPPTAAVPAQGGDHPAPVPRPAAPQAGPDPAPATPAARPAMPVTGSRIAHVEVLGPLRITTRGTEITGGLRKARELMAFLAVNPGGASAEAISEALWPDAGTSHATGQRNLALRKARGMLRGAAGQATPMWILHASGRYRLDPTLISTDLSQFTDALNQARHADADQARLAACRAAARLYRGELAEGEGYEWAEPYAETIRRRALDAWTTIAGILEPSDPGQALAALESALSHDPYNEYLYQKIMRLQAAAGHPEAARRTLSLLETRLTDLGITPGTQTRHVAASLLGARNPPPPV